MNIITENLSAMTQAEVGAFILLQLHQFTHGAIPQEPDRQQLIARGPVPKAVLSMFHVAPDGRLINDHAETERLKAVRFSELQRAKGRISGALRRATTVKPEEPFPEAVDRPTLEEVQAYAANVGLAPWKAEDWFNEMNGCGWLDFQHRRVCDWRAVILRVKVKWEADGRPVGPPARITGGTSTGPPALRINELRQVMEAKEREAQELKTRYTTEGPFGLNWQDHPEKREEWIRLRKEIKAINTRIATAA